MNWKNFGMWILHALLSMWALSLAIVLGATGAFGLGGSIALGPIGGILGGLLGIGAAAVIIIPAVALFYTVCWYMLAWIMKALKMFNMLKNNIYIFLGVFWFAMAWLLTAGSFGALTAVSLLLCVPYAISAMAIYAIFGALKAAPTLE